MSIWHLCSAFVTAYLLGSIPTAIWYGEAFYGIDIRRFGSGNAGATNTFRVLGKRAGTIVLLIDVLKGWTATKLANILLFLEVIPDSDLLNYKLFLGFAAVLGHLYPVFAKFRGGKGVATSLGMVLAIAPEVALVCVLVFLVVLVVSHYVSLSSMIAALFFPMLLLFEVFDDSSTLLLCFGFLLSAIVVLTHRKNIIRLLNGNETPTYLWPKRVK
ncbi:MAG: glycerol-3-phosphate 1-O-acyltransferase PlsY [Runella sp.]